MSLLTNFDIEKHFWREYPQFKILSPFKELYKDDKSRDKVHSSQKMWALAFLCDPSKNNPYRNLPSKERRELLAKDFLKEDEYNWKELDHCIETYGKLALSQDQRSLIAWKKKMQDRDEWIAATPYTVASRKELDEAMANTSKLYDMLVKLEQKADIINDVEEEESSNKSLLDRI